MTQTFVRTAIIGTTFALAIPLWAQRGQGGGGVGRATGSVTGAAAGAVSGSVSQSAGRSGNGAPVSTNVGASNRDNGNAGVNAGHGLGASADISLRVSKTPAYRNSFSRCSPRETRSRARPVASATRASSSVRCT